MADRKLDPAADILPATPSVAPEGTSAALPAIVAATAPAPHGEKANGAPVPVPPPEFANAKDAVQSNVLMTDPQGGLAAGAAGAFLASNFARNADARAAREWAPAALASEELKLPPIAMAPVAGAALVAATSPVPGALPVEAQLATTGPASGPAHNESFAGGHLAPDSQPLSKPVIVAEMAQAMGPRTVEDRQTMEKQLSAIPVEDLRQPHAILTAHTDANGVVSDNDIRGNVIADAAATLHGADKNAFNGAVLTAQNSALDNPGMAPLAPPASMTAQATRPGPRIDGTSQFQEAAMFAAEAGLVAGMPSMAGAVPSLLATSAVAAPPLAASPVETEPPTGKLERANVLMANEQAPGTGVRPATPPPGPPSNAEVASAVPTNGTSPPQADGGGRGPVPPTAQTAAGDPGREIETAHKTENDGGAKVRAGPREVYNNMHVAKVSGGTFMTMNYHDPSGNAYRQDSFVADRTPGATGGAAGTSFAASFGSGLHDPGMTVIGASSHGGSAGSLSAMKADDAKNIFAPRTAPDDGPKEPTVTETPRPTVAASSSTGAAAAPTVKVAGWIGAAPNPFG